MNMRKSVAEKRLIDLSLEDLPILEFVIKTTPVSNDWFADYKKTRRVFMKSLTDSVEDLAFMNLTNDEFMDLIMGRKLPNNLSIRLRIPLEWGGAMDTDNMFLCKTFPHSHNMDRFIIEQSGGDTIWIPNPTRAVYLPASLGGGGDGGNATDDRLSQIAAQIAGSRGME